jgi:threonine/homoserine/homoserine lactone efflux protein
MLTYLVIGMTYAFAAAVQPGPLQAYIVSQTLSHGWRRALPAACSPLLSDGPIIVLVLLVLSRLPAWLIPAVRLAGGVLLLVFAFLAARTWWRFDAGRAAPARAEPRSLLGATAVNLMSPGPYLGWSLVMGPLLLKGWREAPANAIALLAGFYGVMVLSMAGIILLVGVARGLGPRANRTMIGASALALAGLGAYQLWSWVAAPVPR